MPEQDNYGFLGQGEGRPIFPPDEKDLLRTEARFLHDRRRERDTGLLLNVNAGVVSTLYPQIIDGMLRVYNFVEKESTDPLSEDGFINRHIRDVFMQGRLLTNDQIADLRKGMEDRLYSEQFEVFRRFRTAAEAGSPSNQQRQQLQQRQERFDAYRAIRDDGDVFFNKRAVLARVHGLESDLRELYGEANVSRALFTELLLSAPFLETVARGEEIDDEVRDRHTAYIAEATEFAQAVDITKRVAIFEEVSSDFPVRWTDEPSGITVSPFDQAYLKYAYDVAEQVLDGTAGLNEVYGLLRETIMRRGKIFKTETVLTPIGNEIHVLPDEVLGTSFDDIAGYEEQKRFLETLLRKTAEQDPVVDDIKIVLLAGKPGLGKSLAVRAFLNAIPENAKGIKVNIDAQGVRSGALEEYEVIKRIAQYHPDLHIFAVIEDIDALTGDRLHFPATRKFLELDSTTSDAGPKNVHLVATTNRPDIIDPAVTRPGRTAKILIYQEPKLRTRRDIVIFHCEKSGYAFSQQFLTEVAKKTAGFTPDEIRYIFWSLQFEDIPAPTQADIDRLVKEIRIRREVEKQTSGENFAGFARPDDEEEFLEDIVK